MTMTRRRALRYVAGAPAVAAGLGSAVRAADVDATRGEGRRGLKLAPRSKLVMVGDSITDAGRARPVGEGRGDAIGKGYVMMVEALLGAVYPDQWIRVVNQGISGNTVRDLKARWQTDVLEKHRTLFVDSQAPFDEVLKTRYPASINWDRVHPDYVGSMVLARAFVDAIGFDWTR
jgi:lysophospholipase L1-like esterase